MNPVHVAATRILNSGLADRRFASPAEVVRFHGAMQAQDYGPAKWSIAQRTTGVVDADIDALLRSGEIVRTHVLRPTWHFVAASDLLWLLRLTGPRVQRSMRSRQTQLGLDERTLAKAEKLIEEALGGGSRLTRKELAGVLQQNRLSTEGQRLPHILMHCELQGLICSGGFEGRHHTYVLISETGVVDDRGITAEEGIIELARRYLASHGPASLKDMSWWSGLTVTTLRAALEALGDRVVQEALEGITLWSVAGDGHDAQDPKRVYLLQTYDEVVVGYTESRYLGDPHADEARARFMGAGSAPHNLVAYGVQVAGFWRRTIRATAVDIEVQLFHRLDSRGQSALDEAVSELGRFLEVEPRVEVVFL